MKRLAQLASVYRAHRWRNALPAVLLALSIASATFDAARHLEWNLDGVFYAALMSPGHHSIHDVHDSIYREIVTVVPQSAAYALTHGSSNRAELQQSSARFAGQLPFYVTKPLYIALGRACTMFGVQRVHAPYVVSLLSFVLLGLSLPFLAIAAGADRSYAMLVATLAVWLPFFRELGSLATPDATSTMLLISGAAAAMAHAGFGAALLAAAAFVRPDAAVLGAAIFCATQGVAPRPHRWSKLLVVVALLALGLIVPLISGGYGWSAVIRHTFLETVSTSAEAERSISASEYVTALTNGLSGAMTKNPASLIPYLAMALGSYFVRPRGQNSQRQRTALLLNAFVWGGTLVRFLIVPLLADRIFAPAYVCALAMTTALMAPARVPSTRPATAQL